MTNVQAIIATPDLARLQSFYERLLGAVEVRRYPHDGPTFFVGLKLGDSELGLVAEAAADLSAPQRILLGVDVGDVNSLLDRWRRPADTCSDRRRTCHGDNVWPTSTTLTETWST